MAEFRLGRLKFNWRGDWTTSTAYVVDDIVRFGATSYVCTVNHTSDSSSTSKLHLTTQHIGRFILTGFDYRWRSNGLYWICCRRYR